jgi:hypothetical protein
VPITIPVSVHSQTLYAQFRKQRGSPPSFLPVAVIDGGLNYHLNMYSMIERMHEKFQVEFPNVVYFPQGDGKMLRDLVQTAEVLKKDVLSYIMGVDLLGYKRFFISSPVVRGIDEWIRLMIRVLPGATDGFVFMMNLVPFVHAWLKVYDTLGIPHPYMRGFEAEAIQTFVKYDPLYPADILDRVWTVWVPEDSLDFSGETDLHIPVPIALPVMAVYLPMDDEDPIESSDLFPWSVLDLLNISLDEPITNEIASEIVDRISQEIVIMVPFNVIRYKYLKAALFAMRHMEALRNFSGKFCMQIAPAWKQILVQSYGNPVNLELNFGKKSLSDLIAVCGGPHQAPGGGISLTDRVYYLLPALLGPYSRETPVEIFMEKRNYELRIGFIFLARRRESIGPKFSKIHIGNSNL